MYRGTCGPQLVEQKKSLDDLVIKGMDSLS